MVWNGIIQGRFIDLRSIEESDAEFSYNIRNLPHAKGLVGVQVESVEAQREYIRQQREKEGDYYFVAMDKEGNPIGLYGVYDIQGDECETGRVVAIGNAVQNMEIAILAEDFAKNILGLKYSNGVVYKHNTRQVLLQRKQGIEPIGEGVRNGVPCYFYRTELGSSDKVRNLLDQIAGKSSKVSSF